MLRTLIASAVAAAALLPAGALAQSPRADDNHGQDDHGQQVMQKIHDDLTAKGFKDVKVVPGSFVVSGIGQDGKPVMMLIGPDSMTVLTPTDPGTPGDLSQPPQQAQQKDPKLQNWE